MPTQKRSANARAVALREKAAQLIARARDAEQADKNAARKKETHAKIVMGGFVFSLLGRDLGKMSPEMKEKLNKAIVREHDRAVLGLPPLTAQ